MRAYATLQTDIDIKLNESTPLIKAVLPLSVFKIQKKNAISFNQAHSKEDCLKANGRVYLKKICSICNTELDKDSIVKTFSLSDEQRAVFSEERLKQIKQQVDGLFIDAVVSNSEIPETRKSETMGLGLNKKAKAGEKEVFAGLYSFLKHNPESKQNISLLGWVKYRNSCNLCRVFEQEGFLWLQTLTDEQNDYSSDFKQEQSQIYEIIKGLEVDSSEAQVFFNRKSNALPKNLTNDYKKQVMEAIEQQLKNPNKPVERIKPKTINPFCIKPNLIEKQVKEVLARA